MKPRTRTIIFVLLFIAACLIIAISLPNQPTPRTTQTSATEQSHTDTFTAPKDDGFCLAGCPTGAPSDDIRVTHHILELSDNRSTKFADWVAYKITSDTLGSGCKRVWKSDPDLDPEATLRPSDYRGIKAALASDRGHQAPLASLCGSPYWYEADYLSNITPQKSELNEGPWEHLEQGERNLIKNNYTEAVYSVTGPLYEREMPTLPNSSEDEKTPSAYWKVVAVENNKTVEAAFFIMDQNAGRDDDFCENEVSLAEIERRTHLRFFSALDPSQKDDLNNASARKEVSHALGC